MALRVIDGIMGSGKSYYVVNDVLRDALVESDRPIAVTANIEINWQVFLEWCTQFLPRYRRKGHLKAEWIENSKARITTLRHGKTLVVDPVSGRSVVTPIMGERAPKILDPYQQITFDVDQQIVIDQVLYQQLEVEQMSEFWWFTRPNSLIIYDEAADALNSRKWQKLADTKLQSYINHTRHYKDDLYFVAQSYEDLDKQIREKFHYLHNVRNSLKSPVLDDRTTGLMGLALGGMTWPVQFFIVDTFVREGRKMRLMGTHRVWPKAAGFANYDSFSAPSDISGKSFEVSDDAKSEDIGTSFWTRSAVWLRRLPGVFAIFGSAIAVVVFIWAIVTGRMGGKLQEFLLPKVQKQNTTDDDQRTTDLPESDPPLPAVAGATDDVPETNDAALREPTVVPEEKPPEIETIQLVTPRTVVTNKGQYPAAAVPEHLRAAVARFLSGWQ